MGFDMFLKKKIYVGANHKHRKVTGKINIKVDGKPLRIDFKKVSQVVEDVGYWRKAWSIHNWFVSNTQDGIDNCAEYDVSVSELKELLSLCKRIKKAPKANSDLISPESLDLSQRDDLNWYKDQINDTIKILEEVLDNHNDGCDYTYSASW